MTVDDFNEVPSEAFLYKIMPEENLLIRRNCKLNIDKIVGIVMGYINRFDDEKLCTQFFEMCYLNLLYDYAKFVQLLPDTNIHDEIPILERSIARALLILEWFLPNIDAIAHANPMLGGGHKLMFVIFSSALLYEIGSIEQERVIHLCNQDGHFISRWDPLLGFMKDATHFKIRYRIGWQESLLKPLTHCFAKSLMPVASLLWISDSQAALDLWFKLLTDTKEAWLEYGLEFDMREVEKKLPSYLEHIEDIDKKISENTLIGELFWSWLQDAIAKGELTHNKQGADIHVLSDGLILDVDAVFEKFLYYSNLNINKIVLYKQFNHMGFVKLSGSDFLFEKFFSNYNNSSVNMFSSKKDKLINGLFIDDAHNFMAIKHYPITKAIDRKSASFLREFLNKFQNDYVNNINKVDKAR